MIQRDTMRRLVREYGYDQAKVCAAYAAAERNGEVPRESDVNDTSPEAYAEALWKDGHKARGPWILEYCQTIGLKVPSTT